MNEHSVARQWVIVGFVTAALIVAIVVAFLLDVPQEAKIALGIALGTSTLVWLVYAARIFGFLARDNGKRR